MKVLNGKDKNKCSSTKMLPITLWTFSHNLRLELRIFKGLLVALLSINSIRMYRSINRNYRNYRHP